MLQSLVLLTEAMDHFVPVQGPHYLEYLPIEVPWSPWRNWCELHPCHSIGVDAVFQLRFNDIPLEDDSGGRIICPPPQNPLL